MGQAAHAGSWAAGATLTPKTLLSRVTNKTTVRFIMAEETHLALRRRQDLILVSSLFHSTAPGNVVFANCARVLKHAMLAAGEWREEFTDGFEGGVKYPVVTLWYATLRELVLCESELPKLLEGAGNFIEPAGAFFTACWLTQAGQQAAAEIVSKHPELKPKRRGN